MTARVAMLVAAAASALLLALAFGFQAAGFAPCQLCLWQRWPHAAAVLVGMVALALPSLLVGLAGAAAAATTAGIGAYHAGVERDWWPGPSSCSGAGPGLGGLPGEELLSTEGSRGVVMCDEVAWSFAGISMAGWNALISAALAALWLWAALVARRDGRRVTP